MDSKYIILSLMATIILAFLTSKTDACSCMPEHAQTKYCKSDYVIIARVLRKSVRRINNMDVYKIAIKKAYKMTEKSNYHLKEGRLMTASSGSMCGQKLNVGKLYLIAGRNDVVSLCDYVKEYSEMSIVERRGFAGGYKKGCKCEIRAVFNMADAHKAIGTCNWDFWSKCETDFGACVPSRGIMTESGKPIKCHWRQSTPFNTCRKSALEP